MRQNRTVGKSAFIQALLYDPKSAPWCSASSLVRGSEKMRVVYQYYFCSDVFWISSLIECLFVSNTLRSFEAKRKTNVSLLN